MTTYLVTAGALNLRSAAKVADNIVTSLRKGSRVEGLATSHDGLWLKVQNGKKAGWVSSKYLTAESDATGPIVPPEEFPWMSIALSETGTREAPAEANNPRVVEYLRSTDLDQTAASRDSTPWCSGFVNWCVERSGFAGSNSARARSWLSWGKNLSRPRRGCVAVFSRAGGGHVGFFVGSSDSDYLVLGGNQGNQVCVAAYARTRLLGFRLPG
jgi:uncharacterized protein (TIGR02594 family)